MSELRHLQVMFQEIKKCGQLNQDLANASSGEFKAFLESIQGDFTSLQTAVFNEMLKHELDKTPYLGNFQVRSA